MKHCSSCKYCIIDLRAMEICRTLCYKCSLDQTPILYPFLQGLFCKGYVKNRGRK